MSNEVSKIRKELRAHIDTKYKESCKRFYKDKVFLKNLGVKTPLVRKISAKYYSQIKAKTKREIFKLCDQLLVSGYNEEKTIAFDWAFRLRNQYSFEDNKILKKWVKCHITDWGECDDLCTHALGEFIFQFPDFLPRLKEWTKSKNWCVRRASAVALIYSVRRKKYLDSVFLVADKLLMDKEDLVQKGYGWMLKEASRHFQEEVFSFVLKHKDVMPRTALRYAIEKMPQNLRFKAMG